MMTPCQNEELENIRRTAERGKALVERKGMHVQRPPSSAEYLDLFIHIMDTVERIKNDNKAQDSIAGH